MNSRSWITRSSLVCVSGEMVPISSKKMVPLVGDFEVALARRDARR